MFDKKIKKFGLFFIIISLIQLFYIFHFRSGFILDVIKNPFKSDSGHEYAVSSEIIEMKDILLNPPNGFEEVIKKHFTIKKDDIIKTINKWYDETNLTKTIFESEIKELTELI